MKQILVTIYFLQQTTADLIAEFEIMAAQHLAI